jgi:hypothetical protein
LVVTVLPGATEVKTLVPVAVQPVGSWASRCTLRTVVPVALRKVAVTSVGWPGAFHRDGVASSGVPNVLVTSGPPTAEVPVMWTVAVRDVGIEPVWM